MEEITIFWLIRKGYSRTMTDLQGMQKSRPYMRGLIPVRSVNGLEGTFRKKKKPSEWVL